LNFTTVCSEDTSDQSMNSIVKASAAETMRKPSRLRRTGYNTSLDEVTQDYYASETITTDNIQSIHKNQ